MPDRAGDVEQRRDAQDHVAGPDADPVAVGLGVEHDVAVRGHRALRRPGGSRRVGQKGHVAGSERRVLRCLPPGEPARQRDQVLGARAAEPLEGAEHALVAAGLVVKRRGGDHQPHVGAADDLAGHAEVQVFVADKHGGAGVTQDLLKLALLVHRVDRDRDPAGLPGADHRDDELRDVLQVQRDPLAGGETRVGQRGRERAGLDIQLTPGQGGAEVADDRRVRVAADGGAEHRKRAAELRLDVVRLTRVVAGEPRPFVIAGHGRDLRERRRVGRAIR